MKIEYWTNDESGWRQVTREEYDQFDGEKEIRPASWRWILVQSMLQKYRYM